MLFGPEPLKICLKSAETDFGHDVAKQAINRKDCPRVVHPNGACTAMCNVQGDQVIEIDSIADGPDAFNNPVF